MTYIIVVQFISLLKLALRLVGTCTISGKCNKLLYSREFYYQQTFTAAEEGYCASCSRYMPPRTTWYAWYCTCDVHTGATAYVRSFCSNCNHVGSPCNYLANQEAGHCQATGSCNSQYEGNYSIN